MKPIYTILLACVATALLCAAGCITADNGDEATPMETATPTPTGAPEETVLVDDTNNGQTIAVGEGATIIVKLPENPSTGYSWNLTETDGLAVAGDEYIAPETQMPGAGGMHSWTMKPEATGVVTFSAVYIRPWEGEQADDQTYTISFYVVPTSASLITVTEDQNGTTVPVPEGDVVRVKLEENPTTGYRWNATVSGSAVIAADTYIMSAEAYQGMVGAGGTREWFVTFPDGVGGTFDAVYTRPWEEPAEDDESFSVTFTAA
ncbi:MAG TPA: hypothetical protein ENN44_05240 [Methanoculleus sp.]|nr:hypothetical protein [Methanoculleus sp.]